MFDCVLRVKYVSLKSCFVYMCSSHKNLNTGDCFKITYANNKEAYFSATIIKDIVNAECIGINSSFAKLLGINENNFVNISQIDKFPGVNSISITPFSKAEYEILELLAQEVQSNLLNQVRVVNTNQSLVVWIGTNISVRVIIGNVQPVSPGVLDFLTEVVILPYNSLSFKDQNKVQMKLPDNKIESKGVPNLEKFYKFLEVNSGPPHYKMNLKKYQSLLKFKELLYRIYPISKLPQNIQDNLSKAPFRCFIIKDDFMKEVLNDGFYFFKITPLNGDYEKKLYVSLCFFNQIADDNYSVFLKNNTSSIFVDDSIFNFMDCDIGTRVILRRLEEQNLPIVKQIEVKCKKKYAGVVCDKLKSLLKKNLRQGDIILNSKFPIRLENKIYCALNFDTSNCDFCIVNEAFVENRRFLYLEEDVRPLDNNNAEIEVADQFCTQISPIKKTMEKVISDFCRNSEFNVENVIITGKAGTGKTSFLKYITNILKNYPYFIRIITVECKAIKGKTVDSLHKYFSEIIGKLILCQPSILILDDLEMICEKCEGEETPNTVYFNRIGEMLFALLSEMPSCNTIGVLASAQSVSKLNANIYRSRGNYLFKNVYDLGELNKTDREELLKYFFNKHLVEGDIDYSELSLKTDGFVIQDIEDFYKKTLFEAYKEFCPKNEEPSIKQEHCDIAFKKSCALALQDVKFHTQVSKSFIDIGGLKEVKETIIESFLWPVKYPEIYSNAPIRLQTGLLLYGPPGTGKTLLAGAAAKECSLGLISVKGPELLSKYIGASEQAVRDIFEKAQRAKPCILFFDEFDSLAPRRGHDNTGVTDRVVNQLLTQLDGIEALTGVCVLAATSRPDLLDPALLRPGRLDMQMLCPMPTKDDRLEILQILSKNLNFANDVNMEHIARITDGFSGADLQSLLYTAQVSSIRNFNFEEQEETKITVSEITQDIILEALKTTRPSLTKTERLKYERIYAKFQGNDVEDFRAGSKVTLA